MDPRWWESGRGGQGARGGWSGHPGGAGSLPFFGCLVFLTSGLLSQHPALELQPLRQSGIRVPDTCGGHRTHPKMTDDGRGVLRGATARESQAEGRKSRKRVNMRRPAAGTMQTLGDET